MALLKDINDVEAGHDEFVKLQGDAFSSQEAPDPLIGVIGEQIPLDEIGPEFGNIPERSEIAGTEKPCRAISITR